MARETEGTGSYRRPPRNGSLTRDTLIPMGLAATLLVAISGGAVWLNLALQRIDYGLAELRREVQQLDGRMADAWSRADMSVWAELLRAQNPSVTVPTVR